MEKIKVPTIKNDSIVTIQLSGAFYRSLQLVLQYLTEEQPPEEVTNFIEKLNVESKDLLPWEAACETMMILCSEVEKKAHEQELITEIEIDAETGIPVEDATTPVDSLTDANGVTDLEVIPESNLSEDQSVL